MEVIFFVLQFTHVSEHKGAKSKKPKFKFGQNGFSNKISDYLFSA